MRRLDPPRLKCENFLKGKNLNNTHHFKESIIDIEKAERDTIYNIKRL